MNLSNQLQIDSLHCRAICDEHVTEMKKFAAVAFQQS